jgi:hypothetical protein
MEWDPAIEDMIFYMTDEQRGMPNPEDWDEAL